MRDKEFWATVEEIERGEALEISRAVDEAAAKGPAGESELLGRAMRILKGKANPGVVLAEIRRRTTKEGG